MTHVKRLFVFCVLMLLFPSLQAVELGQVRVPLASLSQTDIDTAKRAALKQLLVQVTGRQQVESLPGVSELLADPKKLLTQIGHEANDERLSLVTSFDVRTIIHKLQDAGSPIWSSSRPPLLLWLVEPNGLVTSSRQGLERTAKQRGLPLMMPDAGSAVTSSDIRGRFMEPVLKASKAYGTGLVAVATVYPTAPVTVRWWLYQHDNLIEKGSEQANSINHAESTLVNRLSDIIAERYAVISYDDDSQTRISVNRLKTLSNWHQIDSYLRGLAGMDTAHTVSVKDEQAVWQVDFGGGDQQLKQLMLLNRHLRECDLPVVPAQQTAELSVPKPTQQTGTDYSISADSLGLSASSQPDKVFESDPNDEVNVSNQLQQAPVAPTQAPVIALSFCWRG